MSVTVGEVVEGIRFFLKEVCCSLEIVSCQFQNVTNRIRQFYFDCRLTRGGGVVMIDKKPRSLHTTHIPQLVQEAVAIAQRLGFGQRPTQTHKKMALIDLRRIPALADSGFWVD
jgi:hypothetical protein